MKRRLPVGLSVVVVLGLVVGGVVMFLTPDHRTTFLVDASESSDFREVSDAVDAAASNMSSDDSLALRRFGGACDSANTAELVPPGTGQAAKIGDAARSITPSGKATLLSGILATIDDFARAYPFRGSQTNRIVVVARGAADACGKSADEVRSIIKDHISRAGVKVDFRFVAHRLTPEQFKVLNDIAAATEAQTPRLTKTSEELVTTMKEVSVPADLAAHQVKAPTACDFVTLDLLEAAQAQKEPQRPKDNYLSFKCYRDRYLLARAEVTEPWMVDVWPEVADGVPVFFEFKDEAWQYAFGSVEPHCGEVPLEAWKEWGVFCLFDPVVCRDSNDFRKVTDQTGVGCTVALDIADRYLAAAQAGQTRGTSTSWESGEWSCSKYAFPDRANVANPLHCVRSSDNGTVRLGNNW